MGRAVGPVGIFDSGIGGLSVALEIRRELPQEHLLYVADSAHAPYGDKPPEYIERRARAILTFFEEDPACRNASTAFLGAKAVVVACNTATAVAIDALRAHWSIPIVAIEPAVKPAAAATRSGVVGVMATTQTIASTRFERLTDMFGTGVVILAQPCPGLVERVESGELTAPATRALVQEYVRPLVDKGADTIVLGCTHYPFLREVIASVAGPGVTLIDPAGAVARELRRRLGERDLLADHGSVGTIRFWTTGEPAQMHAVLAGLGVVTDDVQPLAV